MNKRIEPIREQVARYRILQGKMDEAIPKLSGEDRDIVGMQRDALHDYAEAL